MISIMPPDDVLNPLVCWGVEELKLGWLFLKLTLTRLNYF